MGKKQHHLLEVAVSGAQHRKRNRERKKNEGPWVEDRNVDTMARIVENLQEQSSTEQGCLFLVWCQTFARHPPPLPSPKERNDNAGHRN